MKLEEKFTAILEIPENAENASGLISLRLRGMGFGSSCVRCSGSGVYGRMGTCFRCGGTGREKMKLTKALYEKVKEHVENGGLTEYLEGVRMEQKLKAMEKDLFKLMNENELSSDYTKAYRAGKIPKVLLDLRTEQTQVYEAYRERKTKTDMQFSRKDSNEIMEEYIHKISKEKLDIILKKWLDLKSLITSGVLDD